MERSVVLYVEDEDAAYVLFESAVTTANLPIELHRAMDGEEALILLRGRNDGQPRLRPDMMILDLNLPRKNGLELLDEMRGDHDLDRIPVVVFTSSALPSDRRRSLALGARAYVTKPFTYDGFLEAVSTVCSYLPARDRAAHS
jgi:CheY-like chemotaxis protein